MRTIAGTGAALLLLWGASFALSYVDAGPFALALALGIAVVKAAIVMIVFMDFWRSSPSVKLAFFAAIALLATLVGLMIADVETREPEPEISGAWGLEPRDGRGELKAGSEASPPAP